MNAKELREKRAKLVGPIQAVRDKIHNENRAFTGEEDAEWKRINAEYDLLTQQIEMAERIDAIVADQSARPQAPVVPPLENRDEPTGPSLEERRLALVGWLRAGSALGVEQRHIEAAGRCGVDLRANQIVLTLSESRIFRARQHALRQTSPVMAFRAMSVLEGSAGGLLVPETFVSRLEVALLQYGGMLQTSEVIRTATGEKMGWPSVDDTSNEGEQIGEAREHGEQTVAAKQFALASYDFGSKIVRVPYTLIRDAGVDLDGLLADLLGERLGRILNRKFTLGTGAATPEGIITAAPVGKTTASATAILYNELRELQHAVDPAYRTNAAFMFHDIVLLAIRLMQNGIGQYVWHPDVTGRAPSVVDGYPYTINQHMASSITNSAKTVLFGDLSKYKVRLVGQMVFKRFNELYAKTNEIGFVAQMSADGGLLDAGTHPVKVLQQNA